MHSLCVRAPTFRVAFTAFGSTRSRLSRNDIAAWQDIVVRGQVRDSVTPPSPMSEAEPPAKSASKDTGYIPGNDTFTKWRNIFAVLSGSMTDEGTEQFRLDRDERNEKSDCKRCEKQRDYLLQYSMSSCFNSRVPLLMKIRAAGPIIRFMRENIAQLNGDINSSNIRCRRCTTRQSGGFDPDYGIRICANELRNQGHLEDTMAHEMVHAYDHLRFKTEWRDNLRHAACTEVRYGFSMVQK